MKDPMLNDKEKMHPEDRRNLIIFIVISLILWVGFDHYVLNPRMEAVRAEKEKTALEAAEQNLTPEAIAMANETRPRQDIIKETSRLKFSNPVMEGSFNMSLGGRLDDVTLKDYYETLDKKNNVSLFAPAGSEDPEYAEFGWLSKDSGIKTPGKNTKWRYLGTNHLTPKDSLTLFWENGQGLRFERIISLDDKFMFTIKRRVINKSGKDVTLYPYMLVAQHGLPKDFFNRGIVHEGPIAYVNKDLEEVSYKKMKKKRDVVLRGANGWAGLSDHYWMTGLIPPADQDYKYQFSYKPNADPDRVGNYQVDLTGVPETIAAGQSYEISSMMYVGTKDLDSIDAYGKNYDIEHFDLSVDFGMFYFITKPFYHVLMFFFNLIGNFGVAILCLTLTVRLATFPLANKTYKSFAGMSKLAPEMQKLKEKYKDDREKMQQALIKLYEKEKINPMAGCLPMLLQIPIFFAVYKVLMISLDMRHAPFFGWIHDLSAPDPLTVFNLFGLIPWQPPHILLFGAWSCLMLFFMILQRKLSPPPTDPTQKMMANYFPYIISFMLSKFAVGLVIYWTFSNALSVVQQYIILRRAGVEVYLFKSREEKQRMRDEQQKKMEEMRNPKADDENGDADEDSADKDEEKEAKPISPPKHKKKKKKK